MLNASLDRRIEQLWVNAGQPAIGAAAIFARLRLPLLVLLLALLKQGLWLFPNIHYLVAMSRNLTVAEPRCPALQWLYGSFLGPAVAHFLGMNHSVLAYAALHFVVFVVAFVALVMTVEIRHGRVYATLTALLFLSLPVANPILTWLGYSDAWSFALLSLWVIVPRPIALLPIAMLMAVNHFEMGFFAAVALAASMTLLDTHRYRARIVSIFCGLAAGKLGMLLYFSAFSMHFISSRYSYIQQQGLGSFAISLISNPLVLLWSLFSGFWLVLLTQRWRALDRRFRLAALVAFAVCLLPLPLVYDKTRLFALESWPVLLFLVLHLDRSWLEREHHRVLKYLLLSCLVPTIMFWHNNIYSAVLASPLQAAHQWIRGQPFPSDLHHLVRPFYGIGQWSENADAAETTCEPLQ